MNIQDYLWHYPYRLIWRLQHKLMVAFYCEDPLDYYMFQPIKKHLPLAVTYVVRKKKTREFFRKMGIPFVRYPAFPTVVIMARHAAYKFPAPEVVKIGFDHGLYQFKRWTASKYYNAFDLYLVSSPYQVKLARERGIHTTRAVGYPKLDKAFDGTITAARLQEIKEQLRLDEHKETLLFTSTWDVGGLSALDRWIDRVGELTGRYNVLLSVHTWTRPEKIERLKSVVGAHYLEQQDITEYLMLTDYFIGDYNSLIGEACALDKKIITFKVPLSSRAVPQVHRMISEISVQVSDFDQLEAAIEQYRQNPQLLREERQKANQIFYLRLDGKAGKRAADLIIKTIQSKISDFKIPE